jgi:trimeric autotransporter adhesin
MASSLRVLALLLAIVSLSFCSFAQTDRPNLEGTITDASGSTISGARVQILEVATNQTVERRSNPEGFYRFLAVAVGEYTVTVSNSGFRTKLIEDVALQVGATRTLDVRLEIGLASERVEVKAELSPAERTSAVHCNQR